MQKNGRDNSGWDSRDRDDRDRDDRTGTTGTVMSGTEIVRYICKYKLFSTDISNFELHYEEMNFKLYCKVTKTTGTGTTGTGTNIY